MHEFLNNNHIASEYYQARTQGAWGPTPLFIDRKRWKEARARDLLYVQSHRHGWTYQGLWLPSHTDTAGHTKAFDYPVTQTRLVIPRPLNTQSHRHGWSYQGLWLPSHTDTAGHTKAFDYPVTQTRLDIPRPLITQSHRHGWTYQGLWLPSHTDTAGHTKACHEPLPGLLARWRDEGAKPYHEQDSNPHY